MAQRAMFGVHSHGNKNILHIEIQVLKCFKLRVNFKV